AAENLQIALSNELPPEPAALSILGVSDTGEHAQLTLDFAMQHMPELLGKLSTFTRVTYIPGLFRPFSDAARASQLEVYAATKMAPSDSSQVAKVAEEIRAKAAFKQRELPKIDQWLANRTPEPNR